MGLNPALTPWKPNRIMHGFHEMVCLLCEGDDFIFCQEGLIPWSAKWTECMIDESTSPMQKLRLNKLDIVNGLTDAQEAQLAKVKEYMI